MWVFHAAYGEFAHQNATRGPWTCPWDGMEFQHCETLHPQDPKQTWLAGKIDPFFR